MPMRFNTGKSPGSGEFRIFYFTLVEGYRGTLLAEIHAQEVQSSSF